MSLRSFDDSPLVAVSPKRTVVPPPIFPDLQHPPSRSSTRRRRFVRFLVCEALAAFTVVGCALAATRPALAEQGVAELFKILFFVTAAALVIIPILFYGMPRRHYRVRRYG